MSNFLKKVSVIFLWLAGLSLSAHLVIPHDHHVAESFSNQDEKCPASSNKSGHSSGFPLHCHVLNDIVSEKYILRQTSQIIQYNFISLSSFSDKTAFELQVSCKVIIESDKPIFDSYLFELSLLRAPPALA